MNDLVIQQILDERAQNANTQKAYRSTYKKMAQFEQKTHCQFEGGSESMLFEYIADPDSRYDDVVTLNSALPQIKCYLLRVGWSQEVSKLTGRNFDISASMKSVLVDSLETAYQRGFPLYKPNNGDAFFPLTSMAWMGLSCPEALQLADSDIDLVNGCILTQSELTFERMPANMIEILMQYRKAKQSNKENGQVKLPDRIGKFIYRTSFPGTSSAGKVLDSPTGAYFFRQVREKYNKSHTTPIRTTYDDIVQSGKYYKARQIELSGIDWENKKNGALLQKVFTTSRIEPSSLRYNYQMYKKAFGMR